MQAQIDRLTRYPVKSLSGQDLDSVVVTPGQPFPEDRRFAIARSSGVRDGPIDGWLPKRHFAVLVRHQRLAGLETEYNPETTRLIIRRKGRQVATGMLGDQTGRDLINQFLGAYLKNDVVGPVRIVEVPGVNFTDSQEPFIAIINAESLRDLQRVTRQWVDPRRFRGNVLLEGIPAWAERNWIGSTLHAGSVTLEVVEEIGRCAATDVNPETAEPDINMVRTLRSGYGHTKCGVYARVITGGTLHRNDVISLTPSSESH